MADRSDCNCEQALALEDDLTSAQQRIENQAASIETLWAEKAELVRVAEGLRAEKARLSTELVYAERLIAELKGVDCE